MGQCQPLAYASSPYGVRRGARGQHPADSNSFFAVCSPVSPLEEAGERGVVPTRRDQRYFYPRNPVFISLYWRAEGFARRRSYRIRSNVSTLAEHHG